MKFAINLSFSAFTLFFLIGICIFRLKSKDWKNIDNLALFSPGIYFISLILIYSVIEAIYE